MVDEEEIKSKEEPSTESSDKKGSGHRFVPWIIIAGAVVILAGAGFGLGRLLSNEKDKDTAVALEQGQPTVPQPVDLSSSGEQKNWYYELDPVVANLDEPSVTRYVRATLVLEISSEVSQSKGTVFIDEKKPLLTNWLTIYLAGQTIEDIRGDKNLRRIQYQILDTFNEKLFPDSRPQIKNILFKEFAIQ